MLDLLMVNGRVVTPTRAVIPVDDWGFRYGWGAFETIRVHKGCPLFLERHLSRLFRAAGLLLLADARDPMLPLWRREVCRAIEKAQTEEAFINLYWTGRPSPSADEATRIVRVRAMRTYPRRALRLWVAPWRIEPTYPGAGAKTLAYFPYIFAGVMAREAGFDEALILNTSNRLADGASSSIFVIRGGKIVTPSLKEGTLAGITRGLLLELAPKHKTAIRQARIRWADLTKAEAVFISSSLRGVAAVDRIGDIWSGSSVRHPLIRRMQDAYRQEVADEVRRWRSEGHRP